jgi:hypothetical protein
MRYSLIIISFLLLFPLQFVSGQYYDTGQDPSSLKWLQIKTGRFTVIYPEKYGPAGKAFAESLDRSYSKLMALFPDKKFTLPVVIHNFSTQSNGYVVWAPKRMEIFPTPEQNTIPLDADEQLTVHELTHVFQMETLNRGFTKALSFLIGEQSIGIVSSLLPLWLLEGDAVFAESILTGSGRGRTPSFQKQLKALTVESSFYKYDKNLNGSFRDYVPDHYQSGFQMVTWALAKYDIHIWNKVFSFTGEEPFTINPVNVSLLKNAHLTKKRLYNEAFDTLKTIWTKEVADDKAFPYETLNPDKKGRFINYYSPVYVGADSVVAVRTSLSDPPAFVLINSRTKEEKKIHIPGQIFPFLISYAKENIVWVETVADKRWENRDYSVVKIMNLKSNRTRRLSHRSRYLSVAVSPDAKIICATENTADNINSLVFINSGNGQIIQSVPTPGNVYLQHPEWDGKGGIISVIFLNSEGEGIMTYSLKTNTWKTLVEAGTEDLQSSVVRNDSLFFISSHSGTDNIYVRTPDNRVRRITRSRFGTSDLTIKGKYLLFSDYTSAGNSISNILISPAKETGNSGIDTSSFLINRVKIKPPVPENNGKTYTPEPYLKWQHLFRFHSWMPFYADLEQIKSDPASVRPGVTVMTQNSLSTLISTIGYEYSKQRNNVIHARVTWQGWYPIIQTQLDYGNNPVIYKEGAAVNNPANPQPSLRFTTTISFPFNISSGNFTQYFRPSIQTEYNNNYIFIRNAGTYDYGQTIFSGRLFFSNYSTFALRDIFPRWAQVVDFNYSYAPFDRSIYGSDISLKTAFYFPGVFANNGVRFRLEKEEQFRSAFDNMVSFPRGYNNIISKDLTFFSTDYTFPIAYPDFNLASLLYLKRIRTTLFYDYAVGIDNYYRVIDPTGAVTYLRHNDTETFRSFGFELMADFHLFRLPYMISGGVQTIWKKIDKRPTLGLLFSIDLFGFTVGRNQTPGSIHY